MRATHTGSGGRSKLIIALGALMAASVTLAAVALLAWRHEEVLANAQDGLRNVSTLLASQSEQIFQGIDVVQNRLIERLEIEQVRSPDDLRRIGSTRETHDRLVGLTQSLGMLDAMAIIDNHGRLLSSSRGWPAPEVTVTDRDYFRALSTPGAPAVYWSAPVRSRGNGARTIYYARRLSASDGSLIGLVLGMILVERLEQNFAAIAMPGRSAIDLVRDDGVTLVRRSPRLASKEEARRLEPSTILSPDDDEEQREVITAATPVAGYPLSVIASVSRDAALAGWRREAGVIGALALLLNLTIAAAGLLGVRQLRASDKAFVAEQAAARHDVLTGLPNRTYFRERLDLLLASRRETQQEFALLLIDLDHFREINDALGHAAGDQTLRAVAGRLQNAIGPADFLARLGGDEFAIIHPDQGNGLEVPALAENVLDRLSRQIRLIDGEIRISCSIGTAIAGRDADSAAELLAHADLALSRAKEAGRTAIRAYTDDIGTERKQRLSLLSDLRRAVEEQRLSVFFQPIISLQTRKVVGFEALLRWKDERRGFVPPSEFIPLAEESGMIGRLGNWVLEEACRHAATWPEGVKVSVNLSPVQLRTQDVFAQTYAALHAADLPPRRLILEITESVQLEQTHAGMTLRNLRDLGIGVALDDFGTGYASLSYLRSFPFDLIKIDQSFVRDMHRSVESEVIVQTVLALGGRLGMSVTAEGVETLAQLETLQRQGCSKAQGYLFAAPMPADEVLRFLAAWRFPGDEGAPPITLVRSGGTPPAGA